MSFLGGYFISWRGQAYSYSSNDSQELKLVSRTSSGQKEMSESEVKELLRDIVAN